MESVLEQEGVGSPKQLIIKTVTILHALICIDAQSAPSQSWDLYVTNGSATVLQSGLIWARAV